MRVPQPLLALLLCLCSAPLFAAPGAQARAEIGALLNFVEHSDCHFIRNGSEYSPADARAHLQQKLDYLEGRDLVNSAEDFIERAASKSSMSGKPYQVRCADGQHDAGACLTTELKRLRQAP
jgi:hypothetical protein